ncbi:tRNA (adenosine(37)-N6)-threonylcarbamoyltransferase complex transferase subunit TsaD [Candidatus Woesearchaeota archaeon]|nr:tRNA (adenosine(37)-N6)-threonylcarbamoyltransferase complex transferase subunit TsaD [Candidatus Woesearchaeota archaeon]
MICLGLECTAHTFGIGIVDDKGKILADVRDMYQTSMGGIIPHEAAHHHRLVRENLLGQALTEAKLKISDIDFFAVSSGPGLPPCLLAGMEFAKELAKKYNKPLIGVNHIVAHLEIGKLLTKVSDPVFVFVSGANTQIIAHEGGMYRVFGEALSIGLGNALDKFGRIIGLGFPAGPKMEELAKKGKYVELPYNVKGMDVDFSGIITKAESLYKKGASKEDLCFSLQEVCFAMVAEVSERAMAHCEKKETIVIGGVAANKRFCEMLNTMCIDRGANFYPVPLKYCGDNAVMIAWQGMLEYKSMKKLPKILDINPVWRIDEIETFWIK